MGVESEAILFWGLDFATPHLAPWHRSPHSPEDHPLDWEQRFQKLSLKSKDSEKLAQLCSLEFYDCFDHPRYFVAVRGSIQECEDSSALVVTKTIPDPQWESNLKSFCDILDIPWSEPEWHLAARLNH